MPATHTEMTDRALVDAYWATRRLMWNASQGRMARSFGRLQRDEDRLYRELRRRGITLQAGVAK